LGSGVGLLFDESSVIDIGGVGVDPDFIGEPRLVYNVDTLVLQDLSVKGNVLTLVDSMESFVTSNRNGRSNVGLGVGTRVGIGEPDIPILRGSVNELVKRFGGSGSVGLRTLGRASSDVLGHDWDLWDFSGLRFGSRLFGLPLHNHSRVIVRGVVVGVDLVDSGLVDGDVVGRGLVDRRNSSVPVGEQDVVGLDSDGLVDHGRSGVLGDIHIGDDIRVGLMLLLILLLALGLFLSLGVGRHNVVGQLISRRTTTTTTSGRGDGQGMLWRDGLGWSGYSLR